MFDKHVEINEMLENVSVLTSMRSLNNVHSCKFTFNLIVEHVVDKLFVYEMCITCDKLAKFKLKILNDKHCVPYFSDIEVNKFINTCDFEKKYYSHAYILHQKK
jgi:hypothetical protein